jgi:hypothetical protein
VADNPRKDRRRPTSEENARDGSGKGAEKRVNQDQLASASQATKDRTPCQPPPSFGSMTPAGTLERQGTLILRIQRRAYPIF